jgi:hypothetical protein
MPNSPDYGERTSFWLGFTFGWFGACLMWMVI